MKIRNSLLILGLVASGAAGAQTEPAKAQSDAVRLSPFEVRAETDRGYAATSTLSGARMATNLKDTPAMISVMTREFLDDIGAQSIVDFGNWAPNTVVLGDDQFGIRDRDLVEPKLRGVTGGMTRNYFPTMEPIDSFNIERLETSRGPNALLFGDGPLGGLATSSTKRAHFGRAINALNLVFDSWGSRRAALDLNRELPNRKVAGRLNLLSQRNEGWRDSQFYHRDTLHGTVSYRPFKSTQVRAEGEWGRTARDGEAITYSDQTSLWDGITTASSAGAGVSSTGTSRISTATPYYVFNQSQTDLGVRNFQGSLRSLGSGFSLLPADVTGLGLRPGRPTFPYLERRTKTLNPHEAGTELGYKILSLFLEQSIGKLALEFAYNYETDKRNFIRSSSGSRPGSFTMDLSPTLQDGSANPGYMKAYGEGPVNLSYNQNWNYHTRLTAAYPLELGFMTQKFVLMATKTRTEAIESYTRLVRVDNPTLRNALQTPNNLLMRRYWGDGPDSPMIIPDAGVYNGVAFDWRRGNVGGNRGSNLGVQSALVGSYFKNRLTSILGMRQDQIQNNTRVSWATSNDWQQNGIRASDYRPLLKGETTPALLDPLGTSEGVWNSDRMDLIDNTRPYDPQKNPRWSELYPIKKKMNTYSAGLVWFPINAVGAFANVSSGFAGTGWAQKINFAPVEPPKTRGFDVGLKFELLAGRLSGTVSTYRSRQVGYASAGSRTQFYAIYEAAVAGYQQAALNDPANATAHRAKVDLAQQKASTFLPNIAYFDTQNTEAKGYELDLSGRLTKNWSISFNAALPEAFTTNRLQDTKAANAANISQINGYLADTALPATNRNTITTQLNSLNSLLSGGVDGFPLANRTKYTVNIYNSYRVTEGALKGVRIGAGVQARGPFDIATARQVYGVNPANGTTQFFSPKPLDNLKGAGYNLYTLMLGYDRKIGKLTWSLQCNVTNLLDEDKLVFTGYNTYTYLESGVTKGVQVPNGFRYLDPRKLAFTLGARF